MTLSARRSPRFALLVSLASVALLASPGCSAEVDEGAPELAASEEGVRDASGNEVVTATVDTYIKVSAADSSALAAADTCRIPKGAKVTLKGPAADGTHVTGLLMSAHGCGGKFGGGSRVFLYKAHFSGWPTGAVNPGTGKVLAVPYLNQYDDASVNPGGSCGNTSTAMLLRYYGISRTPDNVRSAYDGGGDCGGSYKPWQCPEGLSRIQRSEGLTSKYTRAGSRSMIKRQVDAGRPVIVHGNFTSVGHIMVIVGYDESAKQWVVNDPAGRWCGGVGGGYSSCRGDYESGKTRRYSYASFSNGVLGADGDIWLSTASRSAFSL